MSFDASQARLGDLLTARQLVSAADLERALSLQPRVRGRLGSVLVRTGALSEDNLLEVLSEQLQLPLAERDLPLPEIERLLAGGNEWVRLVPNTREASIAELSPAKVSGTLQVPIGRVRKLAMGGEYLSAFTVGDQLLWGAAEPLRRMLRILVQSRQQTAAA